MQYTDEMNQFLKENTFGRSWKEIAELFNKEFGTDKTPRQIGNVLKRRGYKTGHTGCFKKGNKSNLGRKMSPEAYEKCKATMFKKGGISPRTKPLYSERIGQEGYIEIKVPNKRKWALKQRFVWEQAYGKIPDGNVIIFRDGNRLNCELDNLMCLTRREHAILNRNNLRHNIPELIETEVNIARIIGAIAEREKDSKRKRKAKNSE